MSKKELKPFEGYKPTVKKFLNDLKKNNSKIWFDENRKFYEDSMRDVSKSLVNDMGRRYAEKEMPYIADMRRSMFRINRDIRFSKNKDPYKTNLGVFFPYTLKQTDLKPICALGIYFHLAHDETFIAGGIHTPAPEVLKAFRKHISENWKTLDKLYKNKTFLKEFPEVMEGESLKRMPQGYPQDHPAGNYLKMKQFSVFCRINFKDSHSASLIDLIEQKSVALSPYLEFFQTAIDKHI